MERNEKYKKLLLEAREKCLKEMKKIEKSSLHSSIRDAAGELSGYTQHMADMASDGYEVEKSVKILSEETNLLREIEEALFRIKEGRFGICEACKKPIDQKRLEAIPYAKYCIECQRKRERKVR
jgi:RNA polymerase-binding protein DksA